MTFSIAQLGLLSLASMALAHPHVRHYEGQVAYAAGNSTGLFPTGTGTGIGIPTASRHHGHGHGHGHGGSSIGAASPTTTNELTTTVRLTSTVVRTVVVKSSPAAGGSPPAGSPAPVGAAENNGQICAAPQIITQTVTERATVTVTPSSLAESSSSSSSEVSSEVSSSVAESPSTPPAPAQEAAAPAPPAPVPAPVPSTSEALPEPSPYTPPTPKPVEVEQPKQEEEPKAEVPKPAPPTAEQPAAPKEETVVSPPAPVMPKPAAPAAPSSGKRGLLYNDASLTKCFDGSNSISWAYNWAALPGGDLPAGVEFYPMLWGNRPEFDLKYWPANIEKALAAGAKAILGFNEPDHKDQAAMSPSAAADAWRTHIKPYKGRAKLISPAVTNGPAEQGMGIDGWLKPFLSACGDCDIDGLGVHWYDSAKNVDYFKKHMQDASDAAPGKKLWVTEFGASGSEEEIVAFLNEVLPWMDEQDFIEKYSMFKVDQGLMVSGSEKNAVGRAYADAS